LSNNKIALRRSALSFIMVLSTLYVIEIFWNLLIRHRSLSNSFASADMIVAVFLALMLALMRFLIMRHRTQTGPNGLDRRD
jgi:hypothetical protein